MHFDPVSDQLLENCEALGKVDTSVQELKDQLNSTGVSLSRELAIVKGQISKLQQAPAPTVPVADPAVSHEWSTVSLSFPIRFSSTEQSDSVWFGRETYDQRHKDIRG